MSRIFVREKIVASRYWKSVKKLAKKSGKSIAVIRKAFSGNTEKLYAVAKAKNISQRVGVQIYQNKIKVYTERDIPFDIARSFVLDKRLDRNRFKRYTGEFRSDFPEELLGSLPDDYEFDIVEKGREKGKKLLYWDEYADTPVTFETANRLRYDARIMEIQNALLKLTKKEILDKPKGRSIVNLWPKYAKKRGYLTKFEADKVARKIKKRSGKDKKFFETIREILGVSP